MNTWRCDGCGRDFCESRWPGPCPAGLVADWMENTGDTFLTHYDGSVRVRHAGGQRC